MDITACSPLKVNQILGGTCRLRNVGYFQSATRRYIAERKTLYRLSVVSKLPYSYET
jgi:hypothetical protein